MKYGGSRSPEFVENLLTRGGQDPSPCARPWITKPTERNNYTKQKVI